MKVGDKIFIEPITVLSKRINNGIIETKITKVGRKYFEVEDSLYGKFVIETMKQHNVNYIGNYQAYLSKQEINDKKEANKLYSDLKRHFSSNKTDISLENLKKIKEIIESDN